MAEPDNQQLAYVLSQLLDFMKKAENQTGTFGGVEDNVVRPKGNGSSSMVNVPFSRVQIVDSKGKKEIIENTFKDLLKEFRENKNLTQQEKIENEKIFSSMESLYKKQNEILGEIEEETKKQTAQEKEDLKASLSNLKEQRSVSDRIFELSQGKGLIGKIAAIPLGIFGKVKDNIKVGLREGIGSPLQRLGLMEGNLSRELTKSLEERNQLEVRIRRKENEQFLKKQEEIMKRQGIPLERIAESLSKISFAQEKRISEEFSLRARGKSNTYKADELIEMLKRKLHTGTSGPDSFTSEEQESQSRARNKTLGRIDKDNDRLYSLFQQLSDPRSSLALNVRIVESKIRLGGETSGIKKNTMDDKGGGLFGMIGSGFKKLFLGLGKIIAGFGKGLFGLISKLGTSFSGLLMGAGKSLGGGVLTGAVGLGGATIALGTSLWALKESVETTIQLNKQDREGIRDRQQSAKGFMSALKDMTKEQRDAAIASREVSSIERDLIKLRVKKRSSRKDRGTFGNLLRGAGETLGVVQGFTDDDLKLEATLHRQLLVAKQKQKEAEEIASKATTESEIVKRTPPQKIEKVIESKIPEITNASGKDEVVKEIKELNNMLRDVLTNTSREVQLTRNLQIDTMINQMAAVGPMATTSNIFASPPMDTPNTQGVVRS